MEELNKSCVIFLWINVCVCVCVCVCVRCMMKYVEKGIWRCSSFAMSRPLLETGCSSWTRKRFSFLECMKKSKTIHGIRNISQANCSTLSWESCKVFIQVGDVHVLYFLNCKNEGVLRFWMWKIFPNFLRKKTVTCVCKRSVQRNVWA